MTCFTTATAASHAATSSGAVGDDGDDDEYRASEDARSRDRARARVEMDDDAGELDDGERDAVDIVGAS